MTAKGIGGSLAGAAALIAGLTLLSRLAGFLRTMTLGWAAGDTDLASMYQTANTVPNIIFEIVAGGALAALVVPLVAGPLARSDPAGVARLGSALLSWTLLILVPLALLVIVFAGPIIGFTADQPPAPAADAGIRMLRIFAPQIPLYGVGIVLTGLLQAHRRFAWPVIAPLLSSLVVMATYVTFGLADGRGRTLAQVSDAGVLILAIGTTLGVVVLSLCLLIPLRRLGIALRPAVRFGPAGVAAEVRRLAGAAVVTVLAQQLTLLLVVKLANNGSSGAFAVYGYTQTLFLVPWAVLAVPLATSAYPELTSSAATGDDDRYRAVLARSARAITLLSLLGTAALVALAHPLAALMHAIFSRHPAIDPLADAVLAFAPGLLGYGLYALLSRALYARGQARWATAATVAGWGTAAVASLSLSAALSAADRVTALALANSIGMTVLGAACLLVIARRVSPAALAGVPRALGAGLGAAAVAGAAGYAIARAGLGGADPGIGAAVVWGMMSGAAVAALFLGVAAVLDPHDVRPLLAALGGRLRGGRVRAGVAPATEPVGASDQAHAPETRSLATSDRPEGSGRTSDRTGGSGRTEGSGRPEGSGRRD
jgi:putative peptidoglycan lipid II flippase